MLSRLFSGFYFEIHERKFSVVIIVSPFNVTAAGIVWARLSDSCATPSRKSAVCFYSREENDQDFGTKSKQEEEEEVSSVEGKQRRRLRKNKLVSFVRFLCLDFEASAARKLLFVGFGHWRDFKKQTTPYKQFHL